MKLYTHEEMLDKVLGKEGEPLRDKYEADINSYLMGETIKKARKAKKLSQEQLGELMGVTKSQVCRIENGKNLSFGTIARVFRAMGISASFDMGGYGKVALWLCLVARQALTPLTQTCRHKTFLTSPAGMPLICLL